MSTDLNAVDLAFIIDTTGSMGPFIEAARQQLVDAMTKLSTAADIRLNVGMVEYEDYCDKEVTRVHPFTSDLKSVQKKLAAMRAGGGGDPPEAVYEGVKAACQVLEWRRHARRLGILIGDAPPHAFAHWYAEVFGDRRFRSDGDSYPKECPSGLDPHRASALCESNGITLYGICMGSFPVTEAAFTRITGPTGGWAEAARPGNEVVEAIIKRITKEFEQIDLDGSVFEFVKEHGSSSEALARHAEKTGVAYGAIVQSVARLGKRDLID